MKKIGITTTVPIEILIAAGYQPVDLNNVFIADPSPGRLINIAEKDGFPLNCCSWIKGIYGVCADYGIDTVLGVTTGDCSNTIMLMEVLKLKGVRVIAFAYPDQPDPPKVQAALTMLAETFGTNLEAAAKVRDELKSSRSLALELDRLTWREGVVSGGENHLWLVSTSDFNQDYSKYCRQLQKLVEDRRRRQAYPKDWLRLAYIGVPSVYGHDLYPYLESHRARVVFNEVQRQFAMPRSGDSLAEQYSNYTYPYSIYERLKDIATELERRQIDGVIHYVQAFCHRGIGDIIFRDALKLPVLTLEGNDDFFLSHHVKTRIEAFLDMLRHTRRNLKYSQKTTA
ncbi:MAG: 2-hydroxyglutaryl-CoA dehydratase [Dehalococcoidia bacterium]|nr:MAG: 2-hydroxyglutaryl-CoA dehydratase [Dehalococcoidia bacterium]